MKRIKKGLALLLALTLIVGLVPTVAMASEPVVPMAETDPIVDNGTAIKLETVETEKKGANLSTLFASMAKTTDAPAGFGGESVYAATSGYFGGTNGGVCTTVDLSSYDFTGKRVYLRYYIPSYTSVGETSWKLAVNVSSESYVPDGTATMPFSDSNIVYDAWTCLDITDGLAKLKRDAFCTNIGITYFAGLPNDGTCTVYVDGLYVVVTDPIAGNGTAIKLETVETEKKGANLGTLFAPMAKTRNAPLGYSGESAYAATSGWFTGTNGGVCTAVDLSSYDFTGKSVYLRYYIPSYTSVGETSWKLAVNVSDQAHVPDGTATMPFSDSHIVYDQWACLDITKGLAALKRDAFCTNLGITYFAGLPADGSCTVYVDGLYVVDADPVVANGTAIKLETVETTKVGANLNELFAPMTQTNNAPSGFGGESVYAATSGYFGGTNGGVCTAVDLSTYNFANTKVYLRYYIPSYTSVGETSWKLTVNVSNEAHVPDGTNTMPFSDSNIVYNTWTCLDITEGLAKLKSDAFCTNIGITYFAGLPNEGSCTVYVDGLYVVEADPIVANGTAIKLETVETTKVGANLNELFVPMVKTDDAPFGFGGESVYAATSGWFTGTNGGVCTTVDLSSCDFTDKTVYLRYYIPSYASVGETSWKLAVNVSDRDHVPDGTGTMPFSDSNIVYDQWAYLDITKGLAAVKREAYCTNLGIVYFAGLAEDGGETCTVYVDGLYVIDADPVVVNGTAIKLETVESTKYGANLNELFAPMAKTDDAPFGFSGESVYAATSGWFTGTNGGVCTTVDLSSYNFKNKTVYLRYYISSYDSVGETSWKLTVNVSDNNNVPDGTATMPFSSSDIVYDEWACLDITQGLLDLRRNAYCSDIGITYFAGLAEGGGTCTVYVDGLYVVETDSIVANGTAIKLETVESTKVGANLNELFVPMAKTTDAPFGFGGESVYAATSGWFAGTNGGVCTTVDLSGYDFTNKTVYLRYYIPAYTHVGETSWKLTVNESQLSYVPSGTGTMPFSNSDIEYDRWAYLDITQGLAALKNNAFCTNLGITYFAGLEEGSGETCTVYVDGLYVVNPIDMSGDLSLERVEVLDQTRILLTFSQSVVLDEPEANIRLVNDKFHVKQDENGPYIWQGRLEYFDAAHTQVAFVLYDSLRNHATLSVTGLDDLYGRGYEKDGYQLRLFVTDNEMHASHNGVLDSIVGVTGKMILTDPMVEDKDSIWMGIDREKIPQGNLTVTDITVVADTDAIVTFSAPIEILDDPFIAVRLLNEHGYLIWGDLDGNGVSPSDEGAYPVQWACTWSWANEEHTKIRLSAIGNPYCMGNFTDLAKMDLSTFGEGAHLTIGFEENNASIVTDNGRVDNIRLASDPRIRLTATELRSDRDSVFGPFTYNYTPRDVTSSARIINDMQIRVTFSEPVEFTGLCYMAVRMISPEGGVYWFGDAFNAVPVQFPGSWEWENNSHTSLLWTIRGDNIFGVCNLTDIINYKNGLEALKGTPIRFCIEEFSNEDITVAGYNGRVENFAARDGMNHLKATVPGYYDGVYMKLNESALKNAKEISLLSVKAVSDQTVELTFSEPVKVIGDETAPTFSLRYVTKSGNTEVLSDGKLANFKGTVAPKAEDPNVLVWTLESPHADSLTDLFTYAGNFRWNQGARVVMVIENTSGKLPTTANMRMWGITSLDGMRTLSVKLSYNPTIERDVEVGYDLPAAEMQVEVETVTEYYTNYTPYILISASMAVAGTVVMTLLLVKRKKEEK